MSVSSHSRFISEDPVGFDGGINFYTYVSNGVLNDTDPLGLSARDVEEILNQVKKSVDRLNANGLRRPGRGLMNGWRNNLATSLGAPYLGCGQQADRVTVDLQFRKYDDKWTFTVETVHGGLHQVGFARSSNPADPVIIYDPWQNETYTRPAK